MSHNPWSPRQHRMYWMKRFNTAHKLLLRVYDERDLLSYETQDVLQKYMQGILRRKRRKQVSP